jgi:hypothetical protein
VLTLLQALLILANGAWTQSSAVLTRVHAHEFGKVALESRECAITAKVWFTAPEAGYRERSKVRNVYRFRARVKLGDRALTSGEFKTSTPGRKVWTWTTDTSAEGCWAKDKPALRQVVVNGCRGQRCPVPELE